MSVRRMERAYNRVGFSVIALYGALAVVSGIIGGIFAGVGVAVSMMGGDYSYLVPGGDPGSAMQEITGIVNEIMNGPMMEYMMKGMAVGSAAGMGVGLLLMRKILPKDSTAPLRKQTLSVPQFLHIAIMAFGLWGVGALIGNMPEFFGVSVDNGMLSMEGPSMLWLLIYSVIGAPVFEELAFRKLIIDKTYPYGGTVSAFVSALLFGLMHGNSAQFLLAFCLGLLLATVYINTGRIIYTILLHFMINFTATIPSFLGMAGIDVTIPWYIVVGTLVAVGVLVVILSRKSELLKLKRPYTPYANACAFKNAGMRVAVIGGLVLIAGFEALMLFYNFSSGTGMVSLIRLIPFMLTVIIVILVRHKVGRKTQPMLTSAEPVTLYPNEMADQPNI